MKRRVLIVVLIAGIAGVLLMGRRHPHVPKRSGPVPPPPDAPRPELTARPEGLGGPFVPYRSRRFTLPFSFDYPKNWVTGEEEGRTERYRQVVILGPRNARDTYSAGLTIRVVPTARGGGAYADLEALLRWRRAQHANAPGMRWLKEEAVNVCGLSGQAMEFQFTALLPPGSLEPKPTVLRTRHVAAATGDEIYEFLYSADADDYPRYEAAFDQLLHSLRCSP